MSKPDIACYRVGGFRWEHEDLYSHARPQNQLKSVLVASCLVRYNSNQGQLCM